MKKQIAKPLAVVLSCAMFISVFVPGIFVASSAATSEKTTAFVFTDADADGFVDGWEQAGGIHYEPEDFKSNTAYYYSQNGIFQNGSYGKTINENYSAAFAGASAVETGLSTAPIALKANVFPNRKIKYLNDTAAVVNTDIDAWSASEYSMYTNTAFTETAALSLTQLSGKLDCTGATSDFSKGSCLIVYNYVDPFNWNALAITQSNGNYCLVHIGKRSVASGEEVTYYTTNGSGNSWRVDFYGNHVTNVPVVAEGDIDFTVDYNITENGKTGVKFALSAGGNSDTWFLSELSSGTGQSKNAYNAFNSAESIAANSIMGDYGASAKNFALGVRNVNLEDSVIYKNVAVKYLVDATEDIIAEFKDRYAALLSKEAGQITLADEADLTAALAAYETFDAGVKEALSAQKAKLDAFNDRIIELKALEESASFCMDFGALLESDDIAIKDKGDLYSAMDRYAEMSDGAKTEVLKQYPDIAAKFEALETLLYKKMMLAGDITSDPRFAAKALVVKDTGLTVTTPMQADSGSITTAVADACAPMVLNEAYLSGLLLQKVSFEMDYSDITTAWGNKSDSLYLYCLDGAYKSTFLYAVDDAIRFRQGDFSGGDNQVSGFSPDMRVRFEIVYDYSRNNGESIGFMVNAYNAQTNAYIGSSNALFGNTYTDRNHTVFGFDTAEKDQDKSTYYNLRLSWSVASMAGAAVLATEVMEDQDLRFGIYLNDAGKYLPNGATVKEYGIVYMLDHWLNGNDLTKDTVGKSGYKPYVSAVAVQEGDTLPAVYTERVSNSMKDEFIGLKVAGRGYVVYEINGAQYTVYTEATSKHSVVSAIKAVAQKIYDNEQFCAEVPSDTNLIFGEGNSCTVADVGTVLRGDNSYTQEERKAILLSFITAYVDYSKS